MKNLLRIIPLFFCLSAFSAEESIINEYEVSVDSKTARIDIVIKYYGCENHDFKLVTEGCLESSPVQCLSFIETLHPEENLFCNSTYIKEISISAEEHGMVGDYYDGGSLRVADLLAGTSKTVALPQSCKFKLEQLATANEHLNSPHENWRKWAEGAVKRLSAEVEALGCDMNASVNDDGLE